MRMGGKHTLQRPKAHRETTAHFTAIGMPAQQHCVSFRFRRAAFYNGLKSKVGLAAAKTAAMRINLNIDGCGIREFRTT